MSKKGIGIIGTGSIVNTYIKCIEEIDAVELVALFTRSSDRVKKIELEFGIPVYDDLSAFLALPQIDLICVCNESGSHGRAIIQAARSEKHVLCEKPLEVTLQKIDEAIAACKQHKVKLGCVFQNRCGVHFKQVFDAVSKGKLGKLLMGNAHINWYRNTEYYAKNPWRGTLELDGGAAFMNQGIHTIDLLLHLFGPVRSVFGTVRTRVHNIQGEDVGSGILEFANGAIGNITAGTALYPGHPERLEVYGEKGSILMEGGRIVSWNVRDVPEPDFEKGDLDGSGAADPTAISHQNHKKVILDMLDAIREDRLPMVDGPEARRSVEVITALYRSSESQDLVFL
ncbi:Gfo/Idh/MocA family protein [Ulvibacterium sp.]|uniref:Gfo/Idh/MocA family protein n=1 Tax=Ulvibacterium sp. TaxID=2665914 RepID=UPI003BACB5C7